MFAMVHFECMLLLGAPVIGRVLVRYVPDDVGYGPTTRSFQCVSGGQIVGRRKFGGRGSESKVRCSPTDRPFRRAFQNIDVRR